jgi:hypothetical protein
LYNRVLSPADRDSSHLPKSLIVYSALLFLLLCARQLHLQYLQLHGPRFVDDAYYYLVIARNWITTGRSTFDGSLLTNGYHPLWMGLLVLQFKFLGQSLLLTRCLEYAFAVIGLIAALYVVRPRTIIAALIFTFVFFGIAVFIAMNGMETSPFIGFICVLAALLSLGGEQPPNSPTLLGIRDGLMAVGAIAARLDSAVFVIPIVLLARTQGRRKSVTFATILLLGLIYAAINKHYFGVAMPVSGEVKSLGGLQINHALLSTLTENPFSSLSRWFLLIPALAVLSAVLLMSDSAKPERPMLIAFLIGTGIFLARLLFFSSWQIWPWYDYPVLIGLLACAPSLVRITESRFGPILERHSLKFAFVGLIAVALVASTVRAEHLAPDRMDYFVANHDALSAFAGKLDNQTIAMGDRAGNFAYQYQGKIEQTEGLVNDIAYFKVLKARKDIRPTLCARGVNFIASYEHDLGDYQTYQFEPIRPQLSQYTVPAITVRRQDEIGQYSNPKVFNDRAGSGNDVLYFWRLDCPR